jgi:hypothetical protein
VFEDVPDGVLPEPLPSPLDDAPSLDLPLEDDPSPDGDPPADVPPPDAPSPDAPAEAEAFAVPLAAARASVL